MLSSSTTENEWNPVGDTIVGVASSNRFGNSFSTSADFTTVAAGAPDSADNREYGRTVRLSS